MANNVILGYGKVLVVMGVTCGENQRGSKNCGIRLSGKSGVTNSRRGQVSTASVFCYARS